MSEPQLPSRIFVTGGAGFIGSNFIRLAMQRWPEAQITNFDLLTYAASPQTLADVESNPRYHFIRGDIRRPDQVLSAMQDHTDTVMHLAAETHVDRSILSSDDFITTNVLGTHVMLEASRKLGVRCFLYISTDEVYGSIPPGRLSDETWPLKPSSPYSASKAAGEMLVQAYFTTYGFPGLITRGGNNFGPYQHPEKFLPLFITNLLESSKVPLYGDGLNVRDWIHVNDHCRATARVIEAGQPGRVYNIAGGNQFSNLQIAQMLLAALKLDESFIEHVEDRPGHDRRYAMMGQRLSQELGFKSEQTFTQAMQQTIDWYRDNRWWWEPLKAGKFKSYYEQQYAQRGPHNPQK